MRVIVTIDLILSLILVASFLLRKRTRLAKQDEDDVTGLGRGRGLWYRPRTSFLALDEDEVTLMAEKMEGATDDLMARGVYG